MANKKISGYTEKTALDATDWYLIEQSAGTYRKMSSSRLTQVITSSTTYTIGTGGNFANYVDAMAYLKNKYIANTATVILQQVSDLDLTTAASFTWSYLLSSIYAALVMDHPCSSRILIDLNGYKISVGDGTKSCYGLVAETGSALYIYSSAAGSLIQTNKNESGLGICARRGGVIYNETLAANIITIGASGKGFDVGVNAEIGGKIIAGYSNICYNRTGVYSTGISNVNATHVNIANNTIYGFFASYSSLINRSGCTGEQATTATPSIDVVGNVNSIIH